MTPQIRISVIIAGSIGGPVVKSPFISPLSHNQWFSTNVFWGGRASCGNRVGEVRWSDTEGFESQPCQVGVGVTQPPKTGPSTLLVLPNQTCHGSWPS